MQRKTALMLTEPFLLCRVSAVATLCLVSPCFIIPMAAGAGREVSTTVLGTQVKKLRLSDMLEVTQKHLATLPSWSPPYRAWVCKVGVGGIQTVGC